MQSAQIILDEARDQARTMRTLVPDVFSAYTNLAKAAMAAGALDTKTKELIALAIAVTRECDGCIAAHAASVARAGGTSQEVAEAMGVAIMMNGGPGTVWGPRALAGFEEMRDRLTSP